MNGIDMKSFADAYLKWFVVAQKQNVRKNGPEK